MSTAARDGQKRAQRLWDYGELTVDDIVNTALKLARRVGIEKLTMRLLAEELGLSSMVAYYYVPSKEALLDLVADAVLARIEIPRPTAGGWEERLAQLYRNARRELVRYAGVSQLLLVRPLLPNAKRLGDAADDILREAGFDETLFAPASIAISNYLFGHVSFELSHGLRAQNLSRRARSGDGLTLQRRSRKRRAATLDDEFDFGLDILIRGLAAHLK